MTKCTQGKSCRFQVKFRFFPIFFINNKQMLSIIVIKIERWKGLKIVEGQRGKMY